MSYERDYKEAKSYLDTIVDSGLWIYHRGFFTTKRIFPEDLMRKKELFSRLAVEALIRHSSSGLVYYRQEKLKDEELGWVESIGKELELRGIELPWTEILDFGLHPDFLDFRGKDPKTYPRGSRVTLFTPIHTAGDQLENQYSIFKEMYGLDSNFGLVIVNRNSWRGRTAGSLKVISTLQYPLPVYGSVKDIPVWEVPPEVRRGFKNFPTIRPEEFSGFLFS